MVYVRVTTNFGVSYDTFEPKKGFVKTERRRNLAIKSNGILIGLSEKESTEVKEKHKLIALLKEKNLLNVSKIMLGWCFTFDAVYIYRRQIDRTSK